MIDASTLHPKIIYSNHNMKQYLNETKQSPAKDGGAAKSKAISNRASKSHSRISENILPSINKGVVTDHLNDPYMTKTDKMSERTHGAAHKRG